MGPLRILIASDTYPPQMNGAAIATRRLALGLARRGHQVAVVAPSMRFKDETGKETVAGGGESTLFRVKSFPAKPVHPQFRVTSWFGITGKLERMVDGFHPDIIHIQNHFILGRACLKIAARRGIPIVGTNHFMPDNLFEFIPGPLRAPVSAIMWGHFLRTYNRLDCVVAPSHAGRQMLEAIDLTARTRVISNGIDLDRYRRVDPPPSIFLKYAIRQDCPTFVTVGRLERDKNVPLILKATALVSQQEPVQTVIVGTGKDESEFRGLARRLQLGPAAIFTGLVPEEDLPYLYSLGDIYIGAGAAELQGMAVMEAMAAGLPVLAANAVALPELVRDGENGYLFDLDPRSLADRMLLLLDHREKWQEMGQRSLAYIQEHDTRHTLAQVEALYREVIAAPGVSLVGRGLTLTGEETDGTPGTPGPQGA